MSQQGARTTGREDDWWGQLYDGSTGDTGPTAAPDSVDDRFASAAGAVRGETVSGAVDERFGSASTAGEEPFPSDADAVVPAPRAGVDDTMNTPRPTGRAPQRAPWEPPPATPAGPVTFAPGREPPDFADDAPLGGRTPPAPGARTSTDARPSTEGRTSAETPDTRVPASRMSPDPPPPPSLPPPPSPPPPPTAPPPSDGTDTGPGATGSVHRADTDAPAGKVIAGKATSGKATAGQAADAPSPRPASAAPAVPSAAPSRPVPDDSRTAAAGLADPPAQDTPSPSGSPTDTPPDPPASRLDRPAPPPRHRAHVGSRPPTYDAEPTALPPADPDDLGDLVADTVLDGARYGASALRAASVRGDSARYRGEPRRDSMLTARFGTGEQALVLVAMATGARATPGAHRAAAEACHWIGRAVGRSRPRLVEDIQAARRGDLKSGLHRLTDRSLGKLRASAAEQGLEPEEYAATLRCLLLPADPECRTRVFFGAGPGGLFRLRDGEWQDIEPHVGEVTGEPVVGFGSLPDETPEGDRLTMDLGIPTPPNPYEPAPEPPREPFRFRASVARPGDTLLMCTAGLAEPLRGEPELCAYLTDRWSGPEPPGLAAFLADTQVRVKGYADDRTAAAVWEA